MIHPTAIVHKDAEIGPDCEIGPYCIVGPHVVLGRGCRLHAHVVIDGHTQIGEQNEFYPFASVGLKTQDLKWKGGVTWTKIGDRNTVREHVTIHSGTGDGEATVIGSNNNLLAGTHIGHNVIMGNHVIVSMAGVAGHVVLEDHCLVGGMSGIHQFCRIGKMGMVGGCSRISQDVAPFMIVNGNPPETVMVNKVGLERNGVPEASQAALRQAFKILFREGLGFPAGVARVEQEVARVPEVEHLLAFIRASERGVTK